MLGRVVAFAVAWLATLPAAAQHHPVQIVERSVRPVAATASRAPVYSSAVLDLSSHNTIPIDSTLRKRFGIHLVIHRATLGRDMGTPDDIDRAFPDRFQQVARAGLRLGAYHWATPSDSGDRQADDFLRVVKAACDQLPKARRRVVLALDWEPHGNDRNHYMRAPEVGRFLRRAMARTGRDVLVYAYENFIHEQRAEIMATPGLWQLLGRNPLWIANYKVNTDHLGNALRGGMIPPRLAGTPWSNWSLWQYTSGDNGPIADFPSGKIGRELVDRSVFRGARGDLDRFIDRHSWDCTYRTR